MGLIIKNGVIYNGAESEPVVYSLDEREIGVWIDGKPLYQKTITANGLSGVSDWAPLDASVSYDTLVSVDGQRFDNNQKFSFTNGMETAPRFQTKNDGKLYYFTNYTISGDVYITIRYTKTTDTPGSGMWTPQGVPAVHYDGNEKVVGTWFGETLYEKTLYYASKSYAHNDWVELDTMAIATLIDVDTRGTSNGRQMDEQYFRISYLNGKLYYHTPESSSTFYDIYVTLRYTKTTS